LSTRFAIGVMLDARGAGASVISGSGRAADAGPKTFPTGDPAVLPVAGALEPAGTPRVAPGATRTRDRATANRTNTAEGRGAGGAGCMLQLTKTAPRRTTRPIGSGR